MTADPDEDRPLTVPGLLQRHVAERPDHIFLATEDERVTYAEAEARSRILAKGLVAAGARKGTNIAVLFPGSGDFVAATLAAARIGAVVVPITTLSRAEEVRALLVNADIAFVLAASRFRSQDYVKLIGEAVPELDFTRPPAQPSLTAPWLDRAWFSGDLPDGCDPGWSLAALEALAADVPDARFEAIEARVLPSDRLAILHTSGSTGQPKGVMHQHGTLIRHHYNVNRARSYGPDDVYFTTFPFFWIAGFAYGLIATLCEGATIVWSNSTVASETLDLLEREQPTYAAGFWRTVVRLVEDPSYPGRDIGKVRHGNLWPLRAPDTRPADPSLRHDIYGMSETGPGLSLGPDDIDLPEAMRGSCGKFMPTFETRIVDPVSLQDLPIGQEGELWVRGPLMAEGYYGKPRSALYSIDGWYRTNDLGVIDAEGHFFWKARLGDMIKTAGANVSPKEVESVLATVLGNTASIVLGLPDEERGQIVVAVVITEELVDAQAIRAALAERLSSYKVPRRIISLAPGEVPLLSNGKYDMPALTALAIERLAEPA